jgi:hypothetical protein
VRLSNLNYARPVAEAGDFRAREWFARSRLFRHDQELQLEHRSCKSILQLQANLNKRIWNTIGFSSPNSPDPMALTTQDRQVQVMVVMPARSNSDLLSNGLTRSEKGH